jgi:hypothetical protein
MDPGQVLPSASEICIRRGLRQHQADGVPVIAKPRELVVDFHEGDGRSRPCTDLKGGKPTGRPARDPFFEEEKLAKPSAAWVIPERKACIETSSHHGAASAFAALNAEPNENRDHESDGGRASSATPAARSAARTARFSFTWAMVQLWATRADPQYERSRRS